MGWEVWLVPLIALAVWILGSLLRGGVEEKQRNFPRPNAGGGPEGGRPTQRPATDLERFLQEVHRRRQSAETREREATEEAPRRQPERLEGRPQPKPGSTPSRQPPPQRSPRPTIPVAKRQPRRKPVEEAVVVEVVREQTPVPVPVAELLPTAAEIALASLPTRKPPTTKPRPPVGPAPSLAALLTSPEGLRNAFILREILEPPLCKRRGRN